MFDNPTFWLLAVPAVISLGLAKGGFAGVGQIGTPMLALIMPPLEAAAILLPIMIAQDLVSIWVYRKDYSPWNLKVLMPGAVIGVALAWLLAAHISDAAVRILIGTITIGFVLLTWLRPAAQFAEAQQPSSIRGVILGSASGFTSTLSQAGGAPFQMHMLPQKLPKMTFVGTTAIYYGFLNLIKVAPYFALGQFTTAGLTISAALLPLALVTNAFGIWLVRRTPQALFYRITVILLFFIALELLRNGTMDLLGL